MFDFLKKPIFLIILAAALIIAGVWAYISNRNQTKQVEQQAAEEAQQAEEATKIADLSNIDAAGLQTDINAQLAVADAKAAEVDSRYQLIATEVQLPPSLSKGSGDTAYIYSSTADKVNNWVITISNSSGKFVRAKVPKVDYIGDLKAINRSYLKINYITALQTAEKSGGLDFRNANDISEVKITLKNADPKSFLYWFVTYYADNNMKEVQIDASTGAIVTE